MLGQALVCAARANGWNVCTLGREDGPVTDPAFLENALSRLNPDYIFNGIAYTAVDQAESEKEKACALNRAFPALLMAVMLIACAALIGKELVKLARKQPITWKTVNLLVEVKALVILGILLGTYFLSKYTGMFVIGAVFCALGFLVFFRCKKWSYYAITLGLAVGIWCAFRFGLGVSF